MRTYNPELPLINLHVPKCGGQSFRQALEAWFGDKFRWHYFSHKTQSVTPKVEKVNGKYPAGICIHGHFHNLKGYNAVEYYPGITQFISVIREPYERELSNYFYQKNRKKKGMYYGWEKKPIPFDYETIDEYLEARLKQRPYHAVMYPWKFTMLNYKELIEEHFIHIGIVENLQASVDIFAEKLGKGKVEVPVKNTSKHDEVPSEIMKERFLERSRLQYAIYEYVKEKNRLS